MEGGGAAQDGEDRMELFLQTNVKAATPIFSAPKARMSNSQWRSMNKQQNLRATGRGQLLPRVSAVAACIFSRHSSCN
jgi:hypothetical protein